MAELTDRDLRQCQAVPQELAGKQCYYPKLLDYNGRLKAVGMHFHQHAYQALEDGADAMAQVEEGEGLPEWWLPATDKQTARPAHITETCPIAGGVEWVAGCHRVLAGSVVDAATGKAVGWQVRYQQVSYSDCGTIILGSQPDGEVMVASLSLARQLATDYLLAAASREAATPQHQQQQQAEIIDIRTWQQQS